MVWTFLQQQAVGFVMDQRILNVVYGSMTVRTVKASRPVADNNLADESFRNDKREL